MNIVSYAREFATRETKEWFDKNGSYEFKLVGFYDNEIVIALSHDYIKYLIQIKYSNEYPYYKKGHKILQIFPLNVPTFKFIQMMDVQCVQKNINLTQIFAKMLRYLDKLKQTQEEIRQIRHNNTIYKCRILKSKYSYDQIFINQNDKIIPDECARCSNNQIFINRNNKIILKECMICFEKIDVKYVIVPCGHTSICLECLTNLKTKNCPICQTDTEKYMKIFD